MDKVFKHSGLTLKQMDFCNHVLDGERLGPAYRLAFKTKGTDKSDNEAGSKLHARPEIGAYLEKLNLRTEEKRSLTRATKRNLLTEFAEDEDTDVAKRIKAIEVDNLMTGDNKPQEVTFTGLEALLNKVREGYDE